MKTLLLLVLVFAGTSCLAPRIPQVREQWVVLARVENYWEWGYVRRAYVWRDAQGTEYYDYMPLNYYEPGDTLIRLVNR